MLEASLILPVTLTSPPTTTNQHDDDLTGVSSPGPASQSKMFCSHSLVATGGQPSGPIVLWSCGDVVLWWCAGLYLCRAGSEELWADQSWPSVCESPPVIAEPSMTVSPAHSGGGGGQYWGPSMTFTSKVGGYKYVTDQYTALLSSIWGREEHLEHRRRDRMVRYPGPVWSKRTPARRRRLLRPPPPPLKYGWSGWYILVLIFSTARTQETIWTFTSQ